MSRMASASFAGAGECVAAPVHRGRACVCRLAAPGDAVALDTESPEHDAEREIQGLEHRPLLDVELEVRTGAFEPAARVRARPRSTPNAPSASGSETPSRSRAFRTRPGPPSSPRPRRAEQGTAEAGTFFVGPVDEPHRHRRRPCPAIRRSTSRRRARSGTRRASPRSGPSPCDRRAGQLGGSRLGACTSRCRLRRARRPG